MKKSILLATSAFFAFGATAANAVDVDMYGQVNKGIFAFDNGDSVDTNFVDNDRSSTRFGVRGSQALDNGLTASVLFEGELQSNASNTIQGEATLPVGTTATPGDETATFSERHARVGLAGNFGAIFLGKTSTATDGITEIDMAGAGDVMGSGIDRIGGATVLRSSNGFIAADLDESGTLTADDGALTLSSVYDNFDGISNGGVTGALDEGVDFEGGHGDRLNSVRFDTPIFNGFQARIATAQGGDIDGAVLYNGKLDAYEVKAGVGYVANNTSDFVESTWSGSASVRHDSGLAGTVAYGLASLEDETVITDDPQFYYGKVGYSWDQFEVAADYGVYETTVAGNTLLDNTTLVATETDVETSSFGLGGQYNVGSGVSVGALYRYVEADLDQIETEEMNFYGVNMRVKF